MRRALVAIYPGNMPVPVLAEHLRAVGAEVVSENTENVHVTLDLSPDGWGIVDSLTEVETRLSARLGIPGLLLDGRVLSQTNDKACRAESPEGYRCTLDRGHAGAHEAHGTEPGAIEIWEKSNA